MTGCWGCVLRLFIGIGHRNLSNQGIFGERCKTSTDLLDIVGVGAEVFILLPVSPWGPPWGHWFPGLCLRACMNRGGSSSWANLQRESRGLTVSSCSSLHWKGVGGGTGMAAKKWARNSISQKESPKLLINLWKFCFVNNQGNGNVLHLPHW